MIVLYLLSGARLSCPKDWPACWTQGYAQAGRGGKGLSAASSPLMWCTSAHTEAGAGVYLPCPQLGNQFAHVCSLSCSSGYFTPAVAVRACVFLWLWEAKELLAAWGPIAPAWATISQLCLQFPTHPPVFLILPQLPWQVLLCTQGLAAMAQSK